MDFHVKPLTHFCVSLAWEILVVGHFYFLVTQWAQVYKIFVLGDRIPLHVGTLQLSYQAINNGFEKAALYPCPL